MTTPRSMFAEHSLELLSGQVLPGQPPILSGFAAPSGRETQVAISSTRSRALFVPWPCTTVTCPTGEIRIRMGHADSAETYARGPALWARSARVVGA
jgi:hypothetical protein